MKYGYEGAKVSELIGNYKIDGDKIVVTFLDNSKFEVAFTESTEKAILEEMLKQARERNSSDEMSAVQKRKNKAIKLSIYEFIMGLFAGTLGCLSLNELELLYPTISVGLVSIGLTINGYNCGIAKAEIEELEKYSIYLRIKDKIEKTPSDTLFCGVKNKKRSITINTLDNFTLGDVKIIEQNVRRFQRLTDETEEKLGTEEPTLTYRFPPFE